VSFCEHGCDSLNSIKAGSKNVSRKMITMEFVLFFARLWEYLPDELRIEGKNKNLVEKLQPLIEYMLKFVNK
jgi:hypothetical protein